MANAKSCDSSTRKLVHSFAFAHFMHIADSEPLQKKHKLYATSYNTPTFLSFYM